MTQLTEVTGKKTRSSSRSRGRRRAQAARLGMAELAVKKALTSQVALLVLAVGLVLAAGFVEKLF